MEIRKVKGVDYHLPETIADIQHLIKLALESDRKQIRIRGSYHSVKASVDADNSNSDIFVMLSKMNRVQINKAANTVTVEAGCHLGYDKVDPVNISTPSNSLFSQLHAAGFALPDMGGIIHQTVGGFLSTGASGGSNKGSFNDSLECFTFIPADQINPQPITVSKYDRNTDLFYAAGVSMGLFGIIVSATFALVPQFNIKGYENTTTAEDCSIDMSGTGMAGKMSLGDFFLDTPFKRILWYPQPGVSKVVVWQARENRTYEETDYFFKRPYIGLRKIDQIVGGFVYGLIGSHFSIWLSKIKWFNRLFFEKILPFLLKVFVRLDKKDGIGKSIPKYFEDHWYAGLPMDNNVQDKLFPVEFTELWIDFDGRDKKEIVEQVLIRMNCLFQTIYHNGMGAFPGGAFPIELEFGKASKFWMSPGYGSDTLRVDVFWFGKNKTNPCDDYFPLYWNALACFGFRCHWGKYLPDGQGAQGVEYLKARYPRWNDFMELRKKYDPKKIFVNTYWQKHLGI